MIISQAMLLALHGMCYRLIHILASAFPNPGGGGVLRCCLEGGARLKPPNPYPSLRVILAERVLKSDPSLRVILQKGYPLLGIFPKK